MYLSDGHDVVVRLKDLPVPESGAPLPAVVADENCVVLAYISLLTGSSPSSASVREISAKTNAMPIVIVKFESASAHFFGPPNDEALRGHPLFHKGIKPYSVFEIKNSSWIRCLEKMNSVHPKHNREWFLANRRHFVFTFHDSTFEIVSDGFQFHQQTTSMRSARESMLEILEDYA